MSKTTPQYDFNSVNLVIYIWNHRKPLILVSFIAAVIAAVSSLMIPNRFESEVILFPVMENSASQDLLVQSSRKDLLKLGKDEEIDQMLQILNSDDLQHFVVEKYHLMEHYKIDTLKEKYPRNVLKKKYDKYISITPTKFMSISIKVSDTDAQMAADIANDIAKEVNVVMTNMIKVKAVKALELVETEYNSVLDKFHALEDSLDVIRSYGVVDYEKQAERYSEALGNALIRNNKEAAKELEEKLAVLAKYGGPYLAITEYLTFSRERLSELEAKYIEAKLDASENLDKVFILNKAVKADKKSYPKRSIIVVVSTLTTFILMVLLLIIKDTIQSYSKKEE